MLGSPLGIAESVPSSFACWRVMSTQYAFVGEISRGNEKLPLSIKDLLWVFNTSSVYS